MLVGNYGGVEQISYTSPSHQDLISIALLSITFTYTPISRGENFSTPAPIDHYMGSLCLYTV